MSPTNSCLKRSSTSAASLLALTQGESPFWATIGRALPTISSRTEHDDWLGILSYPQSMWYQRIQFLSPQWCEELFCTIWLPLWLQSMVLRNCSESLHSSLFNPSISLHFQVLHRSRHFLGTSQYFGFRIQAQSNALELTHSLFFLYPLK